MSENTTASGVLIERLDGIFKVIAQALGIAERIQKLFPQERNKRIFSDVIEPIFNELLKVHDAYVHVYSHGTSLVTALIVERPDDLDDRLEKIRASFREKAAEFEGKRSALRGQADAFIRVFDEGSAERAFIWSVIEYFLRNDNSGQSVTDILEEADYIAEVGYHTALRSPISRTLQILTSGTEPEKILAALNGERAALSARFTDAARCYHTARIHLLGLK